MRVTKDNGHAYCSSDNTAEVNFDVDKWLWLGRELPRVLEFPKFWREGGRQYRVTKCGFGHTLFPGNFQVVRIPQGSELWADYKAAKIEEY